MTTSHPLGKENLTMTLQTFNRYVDNVTAVNRTRPSSELPGVLLVGDQILYWAEDIKKVRKPFKAKGRHRKEKITVGVFFRGLFPIPRKHSLFHKWFRLFGGWR